MSKKRRIPVDEAFAEWRKDADYVAAYDALDEEFSMAAALIEARSKADLTQEEVAARMETSQSYVAKMEGSRVNPSVKTLRRFAAATGTRLKIAFEPTGDRG